MSRQRTSRPGAAPEGARAARAAAPPGAPPAASAARPAPPAGDSRLPSLALGLAAFLLYLAQAPPVSGDKDSAEFTLVLALAGVAHPTGYPLFTLLGHAWTVAVHALGATWAYAANSWTALGGGVAMYALHRLGLALLALEAAPAGGGAPGSRGRPLAPALRHALAALPVAWLAANPLWTYETTLAEVYAWHLAWALSAATVFVGDLRALEAARGGPPADLPRRAARWGLLCGLGAAHHATFVWVAGPLTAVLAWRLVARGAARPALFALGLGAAVLPLSSDLWILLRGRQPGPAVWAALAPGVGGLVEHVTGRLYGHLLHGFHPSPAQVGLLRVYMWPFLAGGCVALAAAFALARTGLARRTLGALLAAVAANLAFAFGYSASDPSSYFLVPLALGLAGVAPLLGRFAGGRPTGRVAALVAALAVALGAVAYWAPWCAVAEARVRLFRLYDVHVRTMWNAIPFDSAFVFWPDDMYFTLLERQALDHEKPGLVVLHPLTLVNEQPRRRFLARFGFDPRWSEFDRLFAEGRATGKDSLFQLAGEAVEARVNALSPWPVIHFDPARDEVRLLKKPLVPAPSPDR